MRDIERIPTVIIGAGQSGLSVGYHLKRRGVPFVILESKAAVGDTWRRRWDSLRLFTSARYDGLAGMPFPAYKHSFPTKDEMADYLASYATRFALPVRTGVTVERVSKRGGKFLVSAGATQVEADQVVVAMANYQQPRVPAFAANLSPDVVQLHSSAYRNPSQLRDGPVLVVGAGNSGAEIAFELARAGRDVWLSGRETDQTPFRMSSFFGRHIMAPLVLRVLFHRVLTVSTPIGRKARPKGLRGAAPLIRVKAKDLAAAGVTRVARVAGVTDGAAVLEDGRSFAAANVIWCTGYQPGFSFVDLPVFGENGQPVHERGVVPQQPGLYFTGLHFLYAFSSAMVQGVARDAAYVADAIATRSRAVAASGTRGIAERSLAQLGSHDSQEYVNSRR